MRNVTISMDEDLLKAGRKYAHERHIALNALIRQLLAKAVLKTMRKEWLTECFAVMDKAKGNSKGRNWKREDLYRG